MKHADSRPRIHIRPLRDGNAAEWATHPTGRYTFAPSRGAAFDAALAAVGHGAAVVIWEPVA